MIPLHNPGFPFHPCLAGATIGTPTGGFGLREPVIFPVAVTERPKACPHCRGTRLQRYGPSRQRIRAGRINLHPVIYDVTTSRWLCLDCRERRDGSPYTFRFLPVALDRDRSHRATCAQVEAVAIEAIKRPVAHVARENGVSRRTIGRMRQPIIDALASHPATAGK